MATRKTQRTTSRRASRTQKALWRCPRCGHRFVTAHMWHSCSNHRLDDHFRGKPRALRGAFDAYLALVRSFGPVTVIAQQTRIAFQGRVRFAGCAVQRSALKGGLWLKRRAESPLFTSVQQVTARDWIYTFRIAEAGDLSNPELVAFLREAYEIGAQRHPTQLRPTRRGTARS